MHEGRKGWERDGSVSGGTALNGVFGEGHTEKGAEAETCFPGQSVAKQTLPREHVVRPVGGGLESS